MQKNEERRCASHLERLLVETERTRGRRRGARALRGGVRGGRDEPTETAAAVTHNFLSGRDPRPGRATRHP